MVGIRMWTYDTRAGLVVTMADGQKWSLEGRKWNAENANVFDLAEKVREKIAQREQERVEARRTSTDCLATVWSS